MFYKFFIALSISTALLYAGSREAIITCKSGTGRTFLEFEDMDLEGSFQRGSLTIDGGKLNYSSQGSSTIVSHLKHGVYTLRYFEQGRTVRGFVSLEFYALPNTVKNITYSKGTKYTFQAVIAGSSSDARNKQRLNKTIQVSCIATYDWKDI